VVAPVAIVAAQSKLAIEAVNAPRSLSLRSARRSGLRAVVFAPQGAKVLRVSLIRGSKTIEQVLANVGADGVVTVKLPSSRRARQALRKGTYQLLITPGRTASDRGETALRTIRIR
jgi:hypothetical protein